MAEKLEWLRDYWRYVVVGLVMLAIGGGWYWQQQQAATQTAVALQKKTREAASASLSARKRETAQAKSSQAGGYVYIAGAVSHPGLYHVDGRTRWADVVQAAGGLTKDADVAQVNLAKVAKDEENLAIPVRGASQTVPMTTPVNGGTGQRVATAASASGNAIVNLNTATADQLETISGIGPKRAADIIAYRDAHGGFKAATELKQVSGIGDKIYASVAPHITVGP